MADKKTINIDHNFLNYSSKKEKKQTKEKKQQRKAELVKVKPQQLKEVLLQKLKEYKKQKQREKKTSNETVPLHNHVSQSFIDTIQKKKNKTQNNILLDDFQVCAPPPPSFVNPPPSITTPSVFQAPEKEAEAIPISPVGERPLYSNMKNSSLPTYRQWKQKTQRSQPHQENPSKKSNSLRLNVSKKLKVGKNVTQKKVGVFLKSNVMKQNIDEHMVEMKKCKVKTMKNYLKHKNLIKYGSCAPTELLREIYINSQACGGVENKNGRNRIDNFYEKESN